MYSFFNPAQQGFKQQQPNSVLNPKPSPFQQPGSQPPASLMQDDASGKPGTPSMQPNQPQFFQPPNITPQFSTPTAPYIPPQGALPGSVENDPTGKTGSGQNVIEGNVRQTAGGVNFIAAGSGTGGFGGHGTAEANRMADDFLKREGHKPGGQEVANYIRQGMIESDAIQKASNDRAQAMYRDQQTMGTQYAAQPGESEAMARTRNDADFAKQQEVEKSDAMERMKTLLGGDPTRPSDIASDYPNPEGGYSKPKGDVQDVLTRESDRLANEGKAWSAVDRSGGFGLDAGGGPGGFSGGTSQEQKMKALFGGDQAMIQGGNGLRDTRSPQGELMLDQYNKDTEGMSKTDIRNAALAKEGKRGIMGGAIDKLKEKLNPSMSPQSGVTTTAGGTLTPQDANKPGLQRVFDFFKGDLTRERDKAISGSKVNAASRGVFYGTPGVQEEQDITEQYQRGLGQMESEMLQREQDNEFKRLNLAMQLIPQDVDPGSSAPNSDIYSTLGQLFGGGGKDRNASANLGPIGPRPPAGPNLVNTPTTQIPVKKPNIAPPKSSIKIPRFY